MAETKPRMFMIPTPALGSVDDVAPERITSGMNEWITLSREVLQKKRAMAEAGRWKPGPFQELSEDHAFLRPFGAQFCPALQEVNSIGYVLKWPATATFKRMGPRAWQIRSPQEQPFYKYHGHSSFPEAGDADAISIALGWIVVTPPGWSILIKNIPNNLSGWTHGVTFAEGVIRADQATIPIQVHAFLPPSSPDEISVERGQPMCVVMPFRRERLELRVLDDEESIKDALWEAKVDHETFANAPGRYRALYVEDENPSALYPKLQERLEKALAEGTAPGGADEEEPTS